MLDLEFVLLSDDGNREINEDTVGHVAPETEQEARSHGWLFALADGVGGRDHGQLASRAAVAKLQQQFRRGRLGESLRGMLERLTREANTEVFRTAKETGPGGTGMATTLVTCALRADRMAVAHAGDSRCYLIRNQRATLLTGGSFSSVRARYLGMNPESVAQLSEHSIEPGDVLLLCSDGLYSSVEGPEMAAVAGCGYELNHAGSRLIELAKDRDASDNISVVLVRIRSV